MPLLLVAVIAFVLGAAAHAYYARRASARPAVSAGDAGDQDRQIGYHLLLTTLEDESQLDMLLLAKAVTFAWPAEPVRAMIRDISEAAFEAKRALSDTANDTPPLPSAPLERNFGDLLRASIKTWSRAQLLARSGQFPERFLVIQAQATGMLRAVAGELSMLEPNAERAKLLRDMSRRFGRLNQAIVERLRMIPGTNERKG